MTDQRKFKGIWIPADVWLSKELTMQEKIMLVEIDSLSADPERGCFKRNKAFAEFFGLSESRVSEIISGLEKKGFIQVSMKRKGKQIIERNIFMTDRFFGIGGDPSSGLAVTPLRDIEDPSSGLAEESNTKRVIQNSSTKEREPSLSADDIATPEQLDTLFNQSTDTRQKFEMSFDWEPDRNMVCDRLRHTRVPVPTSDQLTNFICEFRNHFEAQSMRQTEHQWIAKLVQWIKRDNVNQSERPKSKQRQPENFGQIDYRAGAEEMGFEVI